MQAQRSANFQFGRWLSSPPSGEEVVITGISGRFPASNNVKEFRDNLFNKKYMLTDIDKRWKVDNAEIPPKGGLIPEINKFDPGYFGIHHRQAENMDPAMRNFIEVALESILDAGIHPKELEGSKTGVFVGYSWSDLEAPSLSEADEPQTFRMTGYERSFIPHRVSYYLKFKGPSYVVDSACSSSFNGIEHAFKAIRTGQCDNALVGGCNLTLHPGTTLQFARYGLLSKDCICKVFDQDANGYVRSETIACIFLQKAKNSRRIYSQIVYSKINDDGFKSEGLSFPSHKMQSQLLKEIYNECGISPNQLSYMELHGTGTKVGDGEELQAVDDAIVTQRDKTLWVGSVKSNIGHAEPASGLSALIKSLIAMEEGLIAPNMHLKRIKTGFTSLEQGRLKVVTEITPLEDEDAVIGVSNFGFGGNNCHVVLKRVSKKKTKEEDDVPRLVCVSGRTEEAVLEILNDLKVKPFDCEYYGMLHHLFKRRFDAHLYRGYIIVGKNGTIVKTSIRHLGEEGVHCWAKFGNFEKYYKQVAQYFVLFPPFQNAMNRINNVLSDKNINIYDVILSKKQSILGSISVQIGIIDTLRELKIEPVVTWTDALGKLISAYFYKILTLPEVIETALSLDPISESNTFQIFTAINKLKINNLDGIKIPHGVSITLDVSDVTTFLDVIGRLYNHGCDIELDKLYQQIKFPVSRNTPMIAPLVKWYHKQVWHSTAFTTFQKKTEMKYDIGLVDENSYLEGHTIDGRNLFPATGYLNIIWEIIAKERFVQPVHLPIVFQNCKFIRATTLPKSGFTSFSVSIQRKSGLFEIAENDTIVMTGQVFIPDDINLYQNNLKELTMTEDPKEYLDEHEVYKELYLRGYNYTGLFKGLEKCNIEASAGLIRWENNWISFMDKMLQIKILQFDSRLLYVPTGIKRLSINPMKHLRIIEELKSEKKVLPVYSYIDSDLIKCGGVEINGLQANAISKRKPILEPVLEKNVFVPNDFSTDLAHSVRINTQIVLEESLEKHVNALEILDEVSTPDSPLLMPLIFNVLEDVPLVHPNLTISTKKTFVDDIPGVKIEAAALSSSSNLLLVVATKLLQRPTLLNQVLTALSPKGFALSREDKDFVFENIDKITILTQHTLQNEKLILFKKTEPKTDKVVLEVSSDDFDWIPKLQDAIKIKSDVVLYSQNKHIEGTLGFVNCIRQEPGGQKIRCFFMLDEAPKFDLKDTFYNLQLNKNMAFNVWKGSQWGTYRHLLLEDAVEDCREHTFVTVTSKGDLSSLRWVEGPLRRHDQSVITTNYCAINFKDIMTASGRIILKVERIKQDSIEGLEYSGKDSEGNRVMGMTDNRCLSDLIVPDVNLCWKIPDYWTLEEAATVPVVYGTVIYGLLLRSTLKRGESILIHSATGGIGIAALNVTLYHGCEVFVTVGTKEKREFLKRHFPQIPDSHIGNSRDTSFEKMIKTETKGRGVDIVLNSLTEEKLRASVRCLARGGRLMEIGKFDLVNNNALNLLLFEKGASYHGIMLDSLFKEPPEAKMIIKRKVSEGIRAGYVKPLPRTVFKHNEVEAAFRYMTTGKHIGKVLVKVKDENQEVVPEIKSLPRFFADPDKVYIILGGLGGFGLELADWLVLRGAKKLVLTSRTGIQSGYQTQRVKIWESYGTSVKISTITIKSKRDSIDLLEDAKKMGPIDGIFNLAVLLEDALFEDQTCDKFRTSLTPKAYATKYLDEVSRDLCPDLRYFVVFSSVSCGRGNAGQTNYGMANSIMERICEKRKVEGLPALAIQWGAIGDVGLVAKMQKDNKELVIGGTLQQKIPSCLSVMDRFLKQENPIVSSMVVAEKRDRRGGSGSAVDVVATILGIKDLKTVSQQCTLTELGMDSMLGNEVMQVLEKEFEIYITPKDLRNLTFAKLIELEAQRTANIQDQKTKQKMIQGTNTLLQHIPDYSLGDKPIVRLPSQVEETEEAPTIFVLPGVEGVVTLLEPFAKNLKAHVFAILYCYKDCEDSIQETAKRIFVNIEEYLPENKKYHLIGYSFGVMVSLELAALLEQNNYSGKIAAIDGSPHYTKAITTHYLPAETEAEFETMILYNILAIFLPVDLIAKNKDKMLQCDNFDDRIEAARLIVPDDLPELKQMTKQPAITLLNRFGAILDYQFGKKKLKSSVKLYKAEHPPVSTTDMEEDFRLSEYFENEVPVMTVKGTHITLLENKELVVDICKLFEIEL